MPTPEALAAAELIEPLRNAISADASPQTVLAKLSESGQDIDAIKFLAQALGPRGSITWAFACLREHGTAGKPERAAAIEAVERWLAEPSDANRRAAQEAAAKVSGTPEGCLALSVFFSEGSIAPPNLQNVPPPPFLAEKIAGAGLLVAAVQQEPERAPERLQRWIQLGLQGAA